MFGKGGGALSAWLKEFLQLVFIQTIQAFVYAIIVSVIAEVYTKSEKLSAAGDTSDYASSLGLICIFALLSVFKIEDVIRRIMGFGQTKADHGNAVRSIAKTAFALNIGKRVLDNGKKIAGGAKNVLSANKDAKKAANRLERRKAALKQDHEAAGGGSSAASSSGGSGTGENKPSAREHLLEKKKRMLHMASNMRSKAQNLNYTPEVKAEMLAKADKLEARAKGIDEALESGAMGGTISSAGNTSANVSASTASSGTKKGSGGLSNYHQSMLNLQEQYEKELSDAKKKRKEGYRSMAKGVVETTGAVIGGTAGGILGFADGDFDEGVRGVISGAGLGDAAGELATNAAFGTKDLVDSAAKATSNAIKDYSTSIKNQYEEEKRNAAAQVKDINSSARSEINRINKNAENARANLEKEVELSTRQTAKAIAKSVGKGTAKAYKSRHGGIQQLDTGLKDLEKHIANSTKNLKLDNSVESID